MGMDYPDIKGTRFTNGTGADNLNGGDHRNAWTSRVLLCADSGRIPTDPLHRKQNMPTGS